MTSQSTVDMLRVMKMGAMASELERQLTDSAYRELGFEERLGLLVTAEWNRRESNRMNRFIRAAHFAVSGASVEGIEYYEDRKLDKAQMLRFSTCKFIDEGHHIILGSTEKRAQVSESQKSAKAIAPADGRRSWL